MTNIVIADMVLVVSKDLYAKYPEDQLLTKFPLIKYQAERYFETMISKI